MHESYASSVISLEKSGALTAYPDTKFIRENHHFPCNQITLLTWIQLSSVIHQAFSPVQLFVKPWNAACQASLSITNFWSFLKLMSIESVMSSNHLILSHPILLSPSIFPRIRVFSNESVLHIRWPKYWSFSFSISPSKEYSGWSPLEWIGWISLQSNGLSSVFSNTTVQKHQFFGAQLSL